MISIQNPRFKYEATLRSVCLLREGAAGRNHRRVDHLVLCGFADAFADAHICGRGGWFSHISAAVIVAQNQRPSRREGDVLKT